MGTRHVTAVFLNGEPRVAQYGQWDGYPSGQGVTILDFLRKSSKKSYSIDDLPTKQEFLDELEKEEEEEEAQES